MRLFTGIAPASDVVDQISAVIEGLQPLAKLRWPPLENLHVTTKFIGEWPEARFDELTGALETVSGTGAIAIALTSFGFFPHSLVIDVHPDDRLIAHAQAVTRALGPLGCPAERRAYRPHITLARIPHGTEVPPLRSAQFDAFEAHEFHLYLSEPKPGGSVYTKLATYDLMREKRAIR